MSKDVQIAMRVEPALADRLDRFIGRLGSTVTRASVARLALVRGLEELEGGLMAETPAGTRGFEILDRKALAPIAELNEEHPILYRVRRPTDREERFVRCSITRDASRLLDATGLAGSDRRTSTLEAFYDAQIEEAARAAFASRGPGGTMRVFTRQDYAKLASLLRGDVALVRLELPPSPQSLPDWVELADAGTVVQHLGQQWIVSWGYGLRKGQAVLVRVAALEAAAKVATDCLSSGVVLLQPESPLPVVAPRVYDGSLDQGAVMTARTSGGSSLQARIHTVGPDVLILHVSTDGYPPLLASGGPVLHEGAVVGVAHPLLFKHEGGRTWSIEVARVSPKTFDAVATQ